MGGKCGRAWTEVELKAHIGKFGMDSIIDNMTMRELIYDARTTVAIVEANNYNTVCVHSAEDSIAAVVAQQCLNRVYTSFDPEEIKEKLGEYQELTLGKGPVFPYLKESEIRLRASQEEKST
ncbi:hypothetical protein PFISCL1PPCAC_1746 [Pristionchus fissidentatus]|uniref:Uncharacterized protein n=1 Tax=Pristionchus fissidentatus TaxID=1538716 RepID=A0AAV5UXK4_9BILA|nr:hypothetical protein PFISCL1PPCAC_1746 [Pristionchus fissidentatus]